MQRLNQIVFNVAWDEVADVAYLSLPDGPGRREIAKTVPIIDRAQQLYGTIDLSGDGELLGIEILGVRRLLPGLTGEGRSSESADE